MAEKRRGLGRGLGALIPSAPETPGDTGENDIRRTQRPVDLFFPSAPNGAGALGSDAGESRSADNNRTPRGGTVVNKEALNVASRRGSTTTRPKKRPKVDPATEGSVGAKAGTDTADLQGSASSDSPNNRRSEDVSLAKNSVERSGEAVDSDIDASMDTHPGMPNPVYGDIETGTKAVDADSQDDPTAVEVAVPEIHNGDVSRETLVAVPGARFAEIPVNSIHANRKQPRTVFDEDEMAELVYSVREIGVLQPIVVRPSVEGGDQQFELVMGERRWRATREAGLETVPAIIRSTADDSLLRDALLENLHRSQLNPLEEAAAYQQLLDDFGCSHDELAERIGRSRPQVSNTLRLMKLPPLVQRRLAAGVLSAGHARALLALVDQAEMEKLAQRVVAEGLSVRSTEEMVAMSDGLRRPNKPSTPRAGARHERLDYLATSLSDRLDTSVKITLGARKGKVSIEFASVDDLNRIMGVLAPG